VVAKGVVMEPLRAKPYKVPPDDSPIDMDGYANQGIRGPSQGNELEHYVGPCKGVSDGEPVKAKWGVTCHPSPRRSTI